MHSLCIALQQGLCYRKDVFSPGARNKETPYDLFATAVIHLKVFANHVNIWRTHVESFL